MLTTKFNYFIILGIQMTLCDALTNTNLTCFRTEQEPCWRVFSWPHRRQWYLSMGGTYHWTSRHPIVSLLFLMNVFIAIILEIKNVGTSFAHNWYMLHIKFFSEGGFFKAHLHFPKEYPLRPPRMKFITEIWHPNSKC